MFRKADLRGADLTDADLTGADLRDVTGATPDQLRSTRSIDGAQLPAALAARLLLPPPVPPSTGHVAPGD
ncbi:pentapeptide repeat-containing protein [Streptomyces sp. NPDC050564]|uniref:pentapeptide repeat-containing protein n=1 Tax=Streptomyces sp. NPDC050564 TaxID=3365631 RepID=UPI0037B07319